jgi:hypothetical protein
MGKHIELVGDNLVIGAPQRKLSFTTPVKKRPEANKATFLNHENVRAEETDP